MDHIIEMLLVALGWVEQAHMAMLRLSDSLEAVLPLQHFLEFAGILWRSQSVVGSVDQSNWKVFEFFHRVKRWILLTILLHVFFSAEIVHLELICLPQLQVVPQTAKACACWEMAAVVDHC